MSSNRKATNLSKAMQVFYKESSDGVSRSRVKKIADMFGLDPDSFLAHVDWVTTDGESGSEYEVTYVA